eukprot:COSAG01_NODE_34045_length_554_cov_1.624176_1_plen_51_part_10
MSAAKRARTEHWSAAIQGQMPTRKLGSAGIDVSVISLGCAHPPLCAPRRGA